MKLNKNSWHARVYSYLSRRQLPDNLCEYFWSYVGCVLVIMLCTCMAIAGLFIVGFVMPSILGVFLLGYNNPKAAYEAGVTLLQLWLSGVGSLALLGGMGWLMANFFNTDAARITNEFLAAKKNKYCPKIDWEDK